MTITLHYLLVKTGYNTIMEIRIEPNHNNPEVIDLVYKEGVNKGNGYLEHMHTYTRKKPLNELQKIVAKIKNNTQYTVLAER